MGYTGHKFDKTLGLSYMQARYYDPVIGRFYGNDPVDVLGHMGNEEGIKGFNRYSYAVNNPYKYTDPNGESIVHATAFFIGAAISGYQAYQETGGTWPQQQNFRSLEELVQHYPYHREGSLEMLLNHLEWAL